MRCTVHYVYEYDCMPVSVACVQAIHRSIASRVRHARRARRGRGGSGMLASPCHCAIARSTHHPIYTSLSVSSTRACMRVVVALYAPFSLSPVLLSPTRLPPPCLFRGEDPPILCLSSPFQLHPIYIYHNTRPSIYIHTARSRAYNLCKASSIDQPAS